MQQMELKQTFKPIISRHNARILFLALCLSVSCNSSINHTDGYIIKGKVDYFENGTAFILDISKKKRDTLNKVEIKEGKFELRGKANIPNLIIQPFQLVHLGIRKADNTETVTSLLLLKDTIVEASIEKVGFYRIFNLEGTNDLVEYNQFTMKATLYINQLDFLEKEIELLSLASEEDKDTTQISIKQKAREKIKQQYDFFSKKFITQYEKTELAYLLAPIHFDTKDERMFLMQLCDTAKKYHSQSFWTQKLCDSVEE